jgi:polyisoprenoid-binding protein YceI
MFKTSILSIILISCFSLFGQWASGQKQAYKPAGNSYVTVTGTSTLHDWEMRSENVSGEAVFTTGESGSPESVESIMFRVNKNTLKSDKSGLDRRAYQALNSTRHPEIIFRTNGSNNIRKSGDRYLVNTKGELTIAGVTRQVDVEATCINGDDRKLVCSGSRSLKMSDFNIDPPVMMMGTLRTGDEITVSYNIVYSR